MPIETGQEPVRHYLRNEAKEVRPDARPQAWKNRRGIGIFDFSDWFRKPRVRRID